MNQEYRGRVSRFLKAGGDPKYVNVKGKAKARHQALENKRVEGKGEGKVAKGNEGKGGKDKRTQITNKFKEV